MLVTFFTSMLFASSQVAPEPQEVTPQPIPYVSYVGAFEQKCTYMTGDVLFDEAQFKHDLKRRFDTANTMIIYHGQGVPRSCIEKARKIAGKIGFRKVIVKIAPDHLDMGPPR